jgi:hypothetical protein
MASRPLAAFNGAPAVRRQDDALAAPGNGPPFDWRALLPVHPAAELFPLMAEAELEETASNIWKNGLRAPVAGWAVDGQSLLDGRNRIDALARLGLLYETADHHLGLKRWTGKQWSKSGGRFWDECKHQNFHDGDPYEIALSLNLHRRHLTSEQKRDLIAKLLKARPAASDRQIAEQAKVNHKTVGAVRAEGEARGEIPHVGTRTDTKGREQPARRKGKAGKKPKPAASDLGAANKSTGAEQLATKEVANADGLGSAIARAWDEAEKALEVLTAHPVAQIVQAIPPGKAALVTEIAGYFTDLAAELTPQPAANGEAPTTGADYSIPPDLSIPLFLDCKVMS